MQCLCNPNNICPLCKILIVLCLTLASGVVGYFIGRRQKSLLKKEE